MVVILVLGMLMLEGHKFEPKLGSTERPVKF